MASVLEGRQVRLEGMTFLNFRQDHRSVGNYVRNHFADKFIIVFLGLDLHRRRGLLLLLFFQIGGSAQGTSARYPATAASSDGLVWLCKVLIEQLDDFLHVSFILALNILFDYFNHTIIFLVL